jgi:hypothetical protein
MVIHLIFIRQHYIDLCDECRVVVFVRHTTTVAVATVWIVGGCSDARIFRSLVCLDGVCDFARTVIVSHFFLTWCCLVRVDSVTWQE